MLSAVAANRVVVEVSIFLWLPRCKVIIQEESNSSAAQPTELCSILLQTVAWSCMLGYKIEYLPQKAT